MIRLHIWDMDGTILDSMRMWDSIVPDYLMSRGFAPEEELATILDPMTFEDSLYYILQHYPAVGSKEKLMEGIFERVKWHYENDLKLFDGIREELDSLKVRGETMVLLSNSPHRLIDIVMEKFDLAKYFAHRFSTEDFGRSKEHPEVFEIVCEVMKTDPSEALVYDDSPFALQAAVKAGCNVREYDRYR